MLCLLWFQLQFALKHIIRSMTTAHLISRCRRHHQMTIELCRHWAECRLQPLCLRSTRFVLCRRRTRSSLTAECSHSAVALVANLHRCRSSTVSTPFTMLLLTVNLWWRFSVAVTRWSQSTHLQTIDVTRRWREDWQSATVVNSTLVVDPTIRLPGFDLHRRQRSLLNRFWTGQGHCNACHKKRGFIDNELCDCGEIQTMSHIIDGGLLRLHEADEAAVDWLTNGS